MSLGVSVAPAKPKIATFANVNKTDTMKANSYTQAPLVIENPSKGLLAFVDKMRERKLAQLEELRDKRDYSIKIIV